MKLGAYTLIRKIAVGGIAEIYDDLIQNHTAWVLSRTHIRFHQYPKWRDTVKLQTWHKVAFKVLYLRDFLLMDEDDLAMKI